MNGEFVENENELKEILIQIRRSGSGYIKSSRFLDGYEFWNILGDEQTAGWPIIYWKKEMRLKICGKL